MRAGAQVVEQHVDEIDAGSIVTTMRGRGYASAAVGMAVGFRDGLGACIGRRETGDVMHLQPDAVAMPCGKKVALTPVATAASGETVNTPCSRSTVASARCASTCRRR